MFLVVEDGPVFVPSALFCIKELAGSSKSFLLAF